MLAAALVALTLNVPLTLSGVQLTGTNLKADELAFLATYFDNQLRAQGIRVVALSEPADALVTGAVERIGKETTQLELKVTKADGTVMASRSVLAPTETELFELLRRTAQEMAAELYRSMQRMPEPQAQVTLPTRSTTPPSTAPGLAIAGVGLLAAGTGIALMVHANNQLASVGRGVPPSYAAAQSQASGAKTVSTAAMVCVGVGAAAVVAGGIWAAVVARKNEGIEVSVFAAPGQGGFVLSGALP